MPIEHGVRREHLGREAADLRELGRPVPSSAASGMPWTLPIGRSGRVHVAVRVDPDQAERLPSLRDVGRGAATDPAPRL